MSEPDLSSLALAIFTILKEVSSRLFIDQPLRKQSDLRVWALRIAAYINHPAMLAKRYVKTPINPSKISYAVMRTRKNTKALAKGKSKKDVEEKKWYYLVLAETVGGRVHFMVKGGLTGNKEEILEKMMEEADRKVEGWEEASVALRLKRGKKKSRLEQIKEEESDSVM